MSATAARPKVRHATLPAVPGVWVTDGRVLAQTLGTVDGGGIVVESALTDDPPVGRRIGNTGESPVDIVLASDYVMWRAFDG